MNLRDDGLLGNVEYVVIALQRVIVVCILLAAKGFLGKVVALEGAALGSVKHQNPLTH